jgi:hypothetical protein
MENKQLVAAEGSGQIEEMKPFLGIKVIATDRDGQKWHGNLHFVGILPFIPEWGLVCTLDRHPGIRLKSIADIQPADEQWTVKTDKIEVK